jgi:hypothetical protein
MVYLGTGQIYVNDLRVEFTLYKTGSAENHKASDDTTLKTELIRALNSSKKESQGGGVYRVKINDGKGYVVYKTPLDVPNSAAIFHYHWNYNLDLPLTAT